jgi:asparagine synthase (glutamine-hydrolysing)
MCGFTILKNNYHTDEKHQMIKHRGLTHEQIKLNLMTLDFYSLAVSSYKTNLVQPIKYKSSYFLFNGEIFNYKLLQKNCKSDLEYLSLLMIKLNYDPIKIYEESLKWDGFWAIAIVKDSCVYFFTDPLGKKQLYYSADGIASEIKPLLNNRRKLNYNEKSFLTSNSSFDSIYRIIPDTLHCYDFNFKLSYSYKKRNYFDLLKISDKSNLFNLLEVAIISRVENKIDGLSLLLSSGLDSNIIKYFLEKNSIKTEFVSFDSTEFKLISHSIDKVAEIKSSTDDINDVVYAYEHGLDYGSLIPNYYLFQKCSNRVVLTGDGADELFGGYNRAKEKETFTYDVFSELPYYHNIRIDRMSMIHTKEARSPFMSHALVKFAAGLNKKERTGKKILKELFKDKLPEYCFAEKTPLRLNNDKEYNKNLINQTFNNLKF